MHAHRSLGGPIRTLPPEVPVGGSAGSAQVSPVVPEGGHRGPDARGALPQSDGL